MKKFISVLVAAMMLIALIATPVLAEPVIPGSGSITINGTSSGNIYAIYLLLDLESYDTDKSAYSYKVNAAWVKVNN